MSNGGFLGVPRYSDASIGPGTWNSDDVMIALANRKLSTYPAYNAWPRAADANIASVSVLNHCNQVVSTAASGVATIRIKSAYGGDAAIGVPASGSAGNVALSGLTSATAKWGAQSVYCAGATLGNFLRISQVGTELTLGTGDMTIELWWYMPGSNANVAILDPRSSSSQAIPLIYFDASNKLRYFVSGADRISGGTVVSQNAWHHIAVSRVSGSTILYLDGAKEGSTYTDATSYVSVSHWYFCGQLISGSLGAGAAGYMQDIRITKGVGRYSGTTLTVPTDPFPDF